MAIVHVLSHSGTLEGSYFEAEDGKPSLI